MLMVRGKIHNALESTDVCFGVIPPGYFPSPKNPRTPLSVTYRLFMYSRQNPRTLIS